MTIPDYKAKLVLVGDCFVGKTTFARYFDSGYIPTYNPTIGVEYGSHVVHIKNSIPIKCQIWDTAGQEKFQGIIRSYYKNIGGIIFMFDVTNERSFQNIKIWLDEFDRNKNSTKYISKILVANKIDDKSKRVVPNREAQQFAKENNLLYCEISVKKNINITLPLEMITEDMYNNKEEIETGFEGFAFENLKIVLKDDRECVLPECPCTIS